MPNQVFSKVQSIFKSASGSHKLNTEDQGKRLATQV